MMEISLTRGSVAAITVTYNRTSTLKKCVAALKTQTRPLDHILIIDNHSSDEELEVLKGIAQSDDRIALRVLDENQGGAGGFEEGMRLAREMFDPDWYWIMDDDAYPRPDCLEKLLSAVSYLQKGSAADCPKTDSSEVIPQYMTRDIRIGNYIMYPNKQNDGFLDSMAEVQNKSPEKESGSINDLNTVRTNITRDKNVRTSDSAAPTKDIGFVAPLIYGIDLQEYQLYHHKRLQGAAFDNIPIAENEGELKPLNPVEANAFVGPLFSKAAVDKAGIADGSLFIYGDDTEYTYRVTRHFEGVMVRDAVIDHQDPPFAGSNYLEPKGWWKEYYSNRNRIFFIRKYALSPWKRLKGYIIMCCQIAGLTAAALVKPKYRGFHKLRAGILIKSLYDGLADNRGKRIDPGRYSKQIEKMSVK